MKKAILFPGLSVFLTGIKVQSVSQLYDSTLAKSMWADEYGIKHAIAYNTGFASSMRTL